MSVPSSFRIRIAGMAAAAVFSALLSSCWRPLFDPDISASQVLADRLGAPVVSFDIESIQKYNAQDALFLPERDDYSVVPRYGLLLRVNDSRLVSTFVQFDTAYGYQTGAQESENIFDDASYIESAPDGSSHASGIGQSSTYLFWTMDLNSLDSSSYSTYLPVNDRVLGVGSVQNSLAATDTTSCCFVDNVGTPCYIIFTYAGGGTPPNFSGASSELSLPFLDSIKTPGSFFDTGTYLYLSCGLSDGTNAVFRWESASPTADPLRYPAAYGPLVAVLSDDTVLAEDGTLMTALSPDLKKRFAFPCGAMKFVHERYDSVKGYAICVFTRTTFVRSSNGDDFGRARIEVYEIPTSDLYTLSS